MLIVALGASALAIALVLLASPRQRWLRVPLPAFPTRVSAVLAAIVALKAWTELFAAGANAFAWLTMLMLAAIGLSYYSTPRRVRR
jgi:hypothetical protein